MFLNSKETKMKDIKKKISFSEMSTKYKIFYYYLHELKLIVSHLMKENTISENDKQKLHKLYSKLLNYKSKFKDSIQIETCEALHLLWTQIERYYDKYNELENQDYQQLQDIVDEIHQLRKLSIK